MKRRTIYAILGLILVAAVVGVILWRLKAEASTQAEPVRSALVDQGSMIVAVSATGKIKPAARVGLTFETAGRVAEVWVEQGDRVEADQPLARLTTDQLELQVERSQAALDAAEAQLAQVRAGPRPKEIEQAEASLRSAQAQLDAAAANRNQIASGPTEAEISAAEAQTAQASAEKEIAQDAYDLIEEDGTEKEHANYDLYTAKQQLAAAEARLDDLLAGADRDQLRAAQANVEAAVAQRDAAQAQLDQILSGATEEEIAEAEAQVDQARAALELAKHTLSEATMRSPFDGVIVEINMTPGEVPPTLEQPIVLVDDSTFHISVAVDELDVSQLKEGQDVEIAIEALPEAKVMGTVESMSPVANLESGVVAYDVIIALDTSEAQLRADLSANATIIANRLSDVLKIPGWAVRVDRETGQTYIHRRDGDEIRRVDVELGVRHEGVVQVLSGLSAGDEVVQLAEGTIFDLDGP